MKKGISLIVLVITIIIIIILAGAVILNLNNNNPMDNANRAALTQEDTDFRSGANLWFANIVSRTLQNPSVKVRNNVTGRTTDRASLTTQWVDIGKVTDKTTVADITNNQVSDINGNPITVEGYYDLEDILVTEWVPNATTTDVYGNVTSSNAGTLLLTTDPKHIYSGYPLSTYNVPTFANEAGTQEENTVKPTSIVDAVGMKPSKAGKTNQYRIAMNKFGNTMFYTFTETLQTKKDNQ